MNGSELRGEHLRDICGHRGYHHRAVHFGRLASGDQADLLREAAHVKLASLFEELVEAVSSHRIDSDGNIVCVATEHLSIHPEVEANARDRPISVIDILHLREILNITYLSTVVTGTLKRDHRLKPKSAYSRVISLLVQGAMITV